MAAVWTPPAKIEDLYARANGGVFGSMNRPTAGARSEVPAPEGNADIQLYSLATPNGWKVGILLEELGVDYDAHYVSIMKLDQFQSGFVAINPNSKIPCAVDKKGGKNGDERVNLFESASIMLYFADKFKKFVPPVEDTAQRAQLMNWLFWQMAGQGPMTGNFGHFFAYAPADKLEVRDYGVNRYGMEVQRLCSVLDQHLEDKEYILGDEYGLADMACFPWFHQIITGYKYENSSAADMLTPSQYKNLVRWHAKILARPAVQRGITVCSGGVGKPWMVSKES
eukprot:TRINITY_DN1097_c0_g1_i1.p1 TRINITY_DN1097_c0_g1~~TRINITY_DN1097_c0_g1_i1.p1  ORF type:complete len:282 (+),score=98.46 TRINITY_DN1097_c0_g1_i1:46-891(+)